LKVSIKNTILSCEHACNTIPAAYRYLFKGRGKILTSHRGWDAGAYACASRMKKKLGMPLIYGSTSRLLIDLNRSLHHPRVFSEFTRALTGRERQAIIQHYYLPYRDRLRQAIVRCVDRHGGVLHLSVHSFTPVMNSARRDADIGLLYDPRRKLEAEFAHRMQTHIQELNPDLQVRRNYPYRGNTDGATTQFRTEFSARTYLGIEIEINQKYPVAGGRRWLDIQEALAQALTRSVK